MIKIRNDERRSHRLNTLSKVWIKSGKNKDAVINRAMKMGVTTATAKDYLKVIEGRYPK